MQFPAVLASVLAMLSYTLFGQTAEKLKVLSIKKDGCCTYEIAIKNESDSIACILHSLFINLNSGTPQGLGLYQKTSYHDYYSLHYSTKDTLYDFDPAPYKGEWLLPAQTLRFSVKIAAPISKKLTSLIFECFYQKDFCYGEAMRDMQQKGLWFTKYRRVEKRIELGE